jgi:hypothetical protein
VDAQQQWSEASGGGEGADGPSLSVELDAVDAERRDAQELATFVGLAHSTPDADPSPFASPRIPRLRDVGLILAGLGVGAALADAVVTASLAAGLTPSPYLGVVTFVLGTLLPAGAWTAWGARGRRERRGQPVEDRFTLSLSAEGFVLRGLARAELRVPLASVCAFEGGRRVVLVDPNGARTELPCDLGDPDAHRALAVRFSDALARIRASGAGYRGRIAGGDAGPRRVLATPPADDGVEAGEPPSSPQRRQRRER